METKEQQNGIASIQVQQPSMPKGGGAISGLGDSFQPNLFSGTGSYTIPLSLSAARGFEPQLSLEYSSGAGNSPFGLGFSLSLPSVMTRTDLNIPRYIGDDRYILEGEGELTPIQSTDNNNDWTILTYSPRVEKTFSKIEQWISKKTGESYWKVVSKTNVTTIYGQSANSRIFNQNQPNQIFKWLPEEQFDAKGNKILFSYLEENSENVPNTIYEQNRNIEANRYLSSVRYGNYFDDNNTEQFAFELVLDYGQYELGNLDSPGVDPHTPSKQWAYRPDPFSTYRSGFEIRTYRLCQNFLLFHNFGQETDGYCLVKQIALSYESQQNYGGLKHTGLSKMIGVTVTGYRKLADGSYESKSMPKTELGYSEFTPPLAPVFQEIGDTTVPFPDYLNNSQFLPVDLNGDGLPGFLFHTPQHTQYYEPLGDGKYAVPTNCDPFPIVGELANGEASLIDIDGNGELELVISNPGKAGFYQKTNHGWSNFQLFPQYPNNISNTSAESVDLNANGKTDYLQADRSKLHIYFSEGKEGYRSSESIARTDGFPRPSPDSLLEVVTFANVFGDGLSHRVRIKSGSVECWPNLGYGNFGEKVSLGNAPCFDENLSNKRIFLTDIDGSGTADIILSYPDHIEVFLNQNGNSFSEAISIILPDGFTNFDQIQFADVLGNGTSCLVFTQMGTQPKHYYYNFVGQLKLPDGTVQSVIKPYLLCEINNNLGAITQLSYASSTRFALADKLAGREWRTKLRFPVHVVEQVTITDIPSGTRSTNRFAYHDGYYDPIERTFRGFGYVESWDTETFEQYQNNGANPDFPVKRINEELYVPPVYTRTWHHTGAKAENGAVSKQYASDYYEGDKQAYAFPDSILEPAIYNAGYETVRQAYAALAGMVIRTEVYADDGSELAGIPFTVEESNSEVDLVFPAEDRPYAVFLVKPHESISYHYERNADDPRVQQQFVLEVDPLSGQPIQSCNVFLPRRTLTSGLTAYPEQMAIKAVGTMKSYIDTADSLAYRYRGVLWETQEFELINLNLQGNPYFTFDLIKQQATEAFANIIAYGEKPLSTGIQASQFTWEKAIYWDENMSKQAVQGTTNAYGLIHHTEKAVFSKAFISEAFNNILTDGIIQSEGGYCFVPDTTDPTNGYYWNKGLVQYYGTVNQFYLPTVTQNDFADSSSTLYAKTELSYDPYSLLPVSLTAYLETSVYNKELYEIDYQAVQYKQHTDINNNITQVLYDPLGLIIVTSLVGKGDGTTGGMTLYPSNGQPAEYIQRKQLKEANLSPFDDVIQHQDYYLQGASTYFYYNLQTYNQGIQTGIIQPVSSIQLQRDNYYRVDGTVTDFTCQTEIDYSDGLSRSIEKKQQTDPDTNQPGTKRWIVSGRSVYNNKGKVCEEYLPYFSNNPYYEAQNELLEENSVPPPTIYHYDALLRIIRTDTPKGFFSKVDFTSWEEFHYDEDDTVLDSPFYNEYYPNKLSPDEKDAIDKAIVFANTPEQKIRNNVGFIFLEIKQLTGGKKLPTYLQPDIQGRVFASIDPRLYAANKANSTELYNFRFYFGMGATEPVTVDSADAGTQMHFSNIFNKLTWSYTARGYYQLISYDRLQRQTELRVKQHDATTPFNLVELFTYGEGVPNSAALNLRGELYMAKDLSGILTNLNYSLTGKALNTTKQLVEEYKKAVNWSETVPLLDNLYSSGYRYNALDYLLAHTTPDQSTTNYTYGISGELQTVSVTFEDGSISPIINAITYDPNKQRTLVYYANGARTKQIYEVNTQRLINLFSTRMNGNTPETIQDITYTYDPVGNITRLRDESFKTVFNNNQQVEPLSDYTYDAVYQLIQASGRQHTGITADAYKNNSTNNNFKQSIFSQLSNINDSDKLENYSESYTYDDSGNLVGKMHKAVSTSWNVETLVEKTNNHLQGFQYDASGNMRQLQINNTVSLSFNCCENLVKAAIIERPEEDDDADYYVYDSHKQRSRKVSERMTHASTVRRIEEKQYIGNFETKLIRTIGDSGTEKTTFKRQTLRVMDGNTCIAIIQTVVSDTVNSESSDLHQIRYQLDNNLGSVALELDENAFIISYEEYYPFGGTAIIAGSNQVEVSLKDYRYSGKECDDSTGLYYYGARYYVSWLGRWLNPDPAGTVDGLNLYTFVKNNPIVYHDKDGRASSSNKYEWIVQSSTSYSSTNYSLNNVLENFGHPESSVVKVYDELASRVGYQASHGGLTKATISDLQLVFEASKPLHFGFNDLLGDEWRSSMESYSGSKRKIPLYSVMRSKTTAFFGTITEVAGFDNLNSVLYAVSGRPAEVHHVLYKAVRPEYANQTSNLMLVQRSERESVYGPGQHELMHMIGSGNSKDKFRVLLPEFEAEYIKWYKAEQSVKTMQVSKLH